MPWPLATEADRRAGEQTPKRKSAGEMGATGPQQGRVGGYVCDCRRRVFVVGEVWHEAVGDGRPHTRQAGGQAGRRAAGEVFGLVLGPVPAP